MLKFQGSTLSFLTYGLYLPRPVCVKYNRLRAGVGRFHSSMFTLELAPSAGCECDAKEQVADGIAQQCAKCCVTNGSRGFDWKVQGTAKQRLPWNLSRWTNINFIPPRQPSSMTFSHSYCVFHSILKQCTCQGDQFYLFWLTSRKVLCLVF